MILYYGTQNIKENKICYRPVLNDFAVINIKMLITILYNKR